MLISLWLRLSFYLQIANLVSSHRPPEHDHVIHQLATLAAVGPHADLTEQHEGIAHKTGPQGHADKLSKQHTHAHRPCHDCTQEQHSSYSFMQALQQVQTVSVTNVWQRIQSGATAVLRSDVRVPTTAWYFVLLCLLGVILWANMHRCVSAALQHLIEEHDEEVLGLEIKIGTLVLWLFSGLLLLKDVTIANPEGYKATELAHVGKVFIRFNAWKLISSFGSEISVDNLDMIGMRLTLEKTISTSNAQDILQYMQVHAPTEQAEQQDDQARLLRLHKVHMEMELTVSTRQLGKSAGATFPQTTLHFDDFEAEAGAASATKVLCMLLERVLKFALASSKEQLKDRRASAGVGSQALPTRTAQV
mmetsp:Transcript_10543/g.19142  ORF Transcript_10543/g.19142 Transcript_10543/m.19142 type:complete len:362 (+) Transcript_10543:77-1162(+)